MKKLVYGLLFVIAFFCTSCKNDLTDANHVVPKYNEMEALTLLVEHLFLDTITFTYSLDLTENEALEYGIPSTLYRKSVDDMEMVNASIASERELQHEIFLFDHHSKTTFKITGDTIISKKEDS